MSLVLLSLVCSSFSHAFSARLALTHGRPSTRARIPALAASTTVEPPTKDYTDRNSDELFYNDEEDDDDDRNYSDLEYNIDLEVSRELKDPYHILLLGATFEKPKITIPYVSSSLEYVLNMPGTEAKDLSRFAREEGLSCLGTWTREECLGLGRKLQMRDIVCRVVPYTVGGQRGWQAKNANEELGRVSSEP
jgi:hypothetical protein